MKLSRLHVHGFGAIEEMAFDFCPGVNLFVGENESGKSTLQQALLAALYGFHEYREAGGRRAGAGGALEARYRPWRDGARYATFVEYEVDGGGRRRIERRFAGSGSDLQVHDLSRGERLDVGADRYGGLTPAQQQACVGAVRGVFTSSACVDQGKLSALADSASLSEALVKALDSNEADVSAREALKRLAEAKDKGVGGPAAHKKPLRGARDEVERAQHDLDEWDRKRDEIAAYVRAEAELATTIEPQRAKIARLRVAKARRELAEADAQVQRLATAERRLQAAQATRDQLGAYRDFAGARPEEVATALARLQQARRRSEELERRRQDEAPRVQALHQRLAERQAVAAGLRHLDAFPAARQDEVRRLHTEWIRAAERLDTARAQQPVETVAQPVETRGFSMPVFLLGTLAAVVVVVAGVALDAAVPAAIVAAVVLAVAAVVATRVRRAPQAPVQQPVAPDTAAFAAAEAEARTRLESALAEAGISGEPPDEAVRRFDGLVAERQRWQEAQREAESVERDLRAFADHDAELQRVAEEHRQTQQRFGALMTAAAIATEDAAAAYREYEAKREGQARLQAAEADVAAAERERDTALAGRSAEQVAQARTECERLLVELAGSARAAAAVDVPGETPATLQAAIDGETAKLHDADNKLTELRTHIAQGLPAGQSRGEIEERIAYWQQEVAKLDRFGRALDLAMRHLDEATKEARKDFVPRLNTAMAGTVGAITGGRYDDILVDFSQDGSPRITLKGPGMPQRVDVSALSLGTVEQCYVALRLAIAGLLSEGGEKMPLVLDDPFVNYDRARLERMLTFLVALSGEHQVLLFSKDETLPAWFAAHVPNPERLRVFAMGGTGNGTLTSAE